MPKLKVISNNKVRANRENAKKSTGPRTVSGKDKVSGNALTHGLTAEKHVIISESIDEFNTFKNSMFWEIYLNLKSAIMHEIKGLFSLIRAIKVVVVSKQSQLLISS